MAIPQVPKRVPRRVPIPPQRQPLQKAIPRYRGIAPRVKLPPPPRNPRQPLQKIAPKPAVYKPRIDKGERDVIPPEPMGGSNNLQKSIPVRARKPTPQKPIPTRTATPPPPPPVPDINMDPLAERAPTPVVQPEPVSHAPARASMVPQTLDQVKEIRPIPNIVPEPYNYLEDHIYRYPESESEKFLGGIQVGDYSIKNLNGFVPDWKVSYTPTFWEDPRHVAQAWMAIKATPPGEQLPEWIDREFIEKAYKYYSYANGDTPWYNWKYLNKDDPGRQWLQSMIPPPIEVTMDKKQYKGIMYSRMAEDPTLRTPENMALLTQAEQQSLTYYDQAMQQDANYNQNVPRWMQIYGSVMSNPITASIANMFPMMMATGVGSLAAAPLTGGGSLAAGAMGIGMMLYTGVGVGVAQQVKTPWLANALAGAAMIGPLGMGLGTLLFPALGTAGGFLAGSLIGAIGGALYGELGVGDWIAKTYGQKYPELQSLSGNKAADAIMLGMDAMAELLVERPLGLAIQGAASYIDPAKYGTPEEFLKSFGQAYRAGTIAYDSGAVYKAATELLPDQVYKPINVVSAEMFGGISHESPGYILRTIATNPLNILPFFNELAINAGLLPGDDINDIRYLDANATFQLGVSPFPVDLPATGVAAMVEMRRRLMKGEDATKLYNEYRDAFGLAGQTSDLLGHMILDPLNWWGDITRKTAAVGADVMGAKDLAKVLRYNNVHGLFEGFRTYEMMLRKGQIKSLDNMAAWEKNLIGWSDQYQDFKVNLPSDKVSTIGRLWDQAWRRKPDAAAIHFVEMASDNFAPLAEPYLAMNNPMGLVKLVEQIGRSPAEAARLFGNQAFASPELYALKGLAGDIAPKLRLIVEGYDGATIQRLFLYRMTDATGLSVGTVLKDIEKITDTGELVRYFQTKLNEAAQKPEFADKANKILSEMEPGANGMAPILMPDNFTALRDTFTGKDAIAPTIEMLFAQMVDVYRTRAGEIASDVYHVKPDGKFFLFMNALKRAQSIALLGFNPGYVVTNVINNAITSLVSIPGWFKLEEGRKAFWASFGMTPYRLRSGIGLSTLVLDSAVEKELKSGVEVRTGEEPIRKASAPPKGIARMIDGAMRGLGKYLPATALSQHFERLQSEMITYKGTKAMMDALWRHGKNYEPVPSELRARLEAADSSLPKWLDNIVRDEYSIEAMVAKITSGEEHYSLTDAITIVARNMGIDTQLIDEVIRQHEGLREGILNAKSETDVRAIFRDLRDRIDDYLDDAVVNDVRDRIAEVRARIASGGEAEAFRIADELSGTLEMYWMVHENMMVDAHAEADSIRAAGGTTADVMRHWLNVENRSNRWWNRLMYFEQNSYRGIFDGLNIHGDGVATFLGKIQERRTKWTEFMTERRRLLREHYQMDFDSGQARENHYQQMLRNIDDLYSRTIDSTNALQRAQDIEFVAMVRIEYGEDVANAAKAWRDSLYDFNRRRADLNQAERDKMRRITNSNDQRREWRRFLDEEYLPLIRDYHRVDEDGIQRMWRIMTGLEPPLPRTPGATHPNPPGVPQVKRAKVISQTPVQQFVNEIRELTRFGAKQEYSIDQEGGYYLGEMIEGHASYLDKTPEEYINDRLNVIRYPDNNTTEGMYRDLIGEKWQTDMYDYFVEQLFGEDTNAYYERAVNLIENIQKKARKEGRAVRENMKTLLSVDVSGNCPFRQMGRPCLYCYVETPRTKHTLVTRIKGEKWGAQSPNNVVRQNKYDGDLLDFYYLDKEKKIVDPVAKEIVEMMNTKMGGLRTFSIGDFTYADKPTLDRVIADAGEIGLNVKMITKQENTLRTYAVRDPVTGKAKYPHVYFNLSTDFDIKNADVQGAAARKRIKATIRLDQSAVKNYDKRYAAWVPKKQKWDLDMAQWKLDMQKWKDDGQVGEPPKKPNYPNPPRKPSAMYAQVPTTPEFNARYQAEYEKWSADYGEWYKKYDKYLQDKQEWDRLAESTPKKEWEEYKKTHDEPEDPGLGPVPPKELPDDWYKNEQTKDIKWWDEAKIEKQVAQLQLGFEQMREYFGFGFSLNKAQELKSKYNANFDDGKTHVTVRYVAMNNGDFVRSVFDPRIDLVTMYHGTVEPKDMFDIWRLQNRNMFRKTKPGTPEYEASLKKYGVLTKVRNDLLDTAISLVAAEKMLPANDIRVLEDPRILELDQRTEIFPDDALIHVNTLVSEDNMKTLAAIFQASDIENIKTKGKFSTVDQRYVDEVMGVNADGSSKYDIDEFLEMAWSKSCCQSGKCGSCAVCCAFATGTREDKIRIYKQVLEGTPRADIEFAEDQRAILRVMPNANVGDVAYGLGFMWRRDLKPEDNLTAGRWAMGKDWDGKVWTEEGQRKFAKGFVKYLATGYGPTKKMTNLFSRFNMFLRGIYERIIGTKEVKLTDEMRGVYARLLGSESPKFSDIDPANPVSLRQTKTPTEKDISLYHAIDDYIDGPDIQAASDAGFIVLRDYSELAPVPEGMIRLYHGTPSFNLESIGKSGLIPQAMQEKWKGIPGATSQVLFSTEPQQKYGGGMYVGDVILAVDVPRTPEIDMQLRTGRVVALNGVPRDSIVAAVVPYGEVNRPLGPSNFRLELGDWNGMYKITDAIREGRRPGDPYVSEIEAQRSAPQSVPFDHFTKENNQVVTPPTLKSDRARSLNLDNTPKRDHVLDMARKIYKDEETAQYNMSILDAHAQMWAEEHADGGYTYQDWYELYIDEVKYLPEYNPTDTSIPDQIYKANFQHVLENLYYSQLTKAIEKLPMEKLTSEQLINMLMKSGVKQEELAWTGMLDFLEDHPKVTKTQLLEFTNREMIQLDEKFLEDSYFMRGRDEVDREIGEHYELEDELTDALENPMESKYFNQEAYDLAEDKDAYIEDIKSQIDQELNDSMEERWDLERELETIDNSGYTTRYKDPIYNLAGDPIDYKELLIQFPNKKNERTDIIPWLERTFWMSKTPTMTTKQWWAQLPVEGKLELLKMYNEEVGQEKYISGHWNGEENVLAHVRFSTREINGEKVLLVEEIQSDWHEQGRERGYQTEEWRQEQARQTRGKYQVLESRYEQFFELEDMWISHTYHNGEMDFRIVRFVNGEPVATNNVGRENLPEHLRPYYDELVQAAKNVGRPRIEVGGRFKGAPVPDAPWKKTWHELTIRRVMKYAADNNFDRVAWTTGDIQNKRWSLTKYVNFLDVEKVGDRYIIAGDVVGDKYKKLKEVDTIEELASQIGKERAAKVEEHYKNNPDGPEIRFEGKDLELGSKPMKVFYDEMVTNYAKKFGKRWGAQYSEVRLKTGPETREFIRADEITREEAMALLGPTNHNDEMIYWEKEYPDGTTKMIRIHSDVYARDGVPVGVPIKREIYKNTTIGETLHSINIPDEMHKSLRSEGVPLFQEETPNGYIAGITYPNQKTGKNVVMIFKKADKSTFIHEMSHVWFMDGSISIADRIVLSRWFEQNGVKGFEWDHSGKPLYDAAHEKAWADAHELFARGWERFLIEGKAPKPELEGAFRKFRTWLINIYYGLRGGEWDQTRLPDLSPEVREVYAHLLGAGNKKSMTEMPVNMVQKEAPILHVSQVQQEGYSQRYNDIIDQLERAVLDNGMVAPGTKIPQELMPDVLKYLRGPVARDLSQAKNAAMGYGIKVRDQALLDYTDQRGIDKLANVIFPYQFWYTRSMLNWAMRIYDRPAWYANYFRLRNFMNKAQEEEGFPSRMKNRVGLPAPYLPDWAGGNVYIDPLNNIFPFESFATGISRYLTGLTAEEKSAINLLYKWSDTGEITREDMKAAIQSRSGEAWNKALSEVQRENKLDLFELASIAQTPSLWISMIYHILKGEPEKIGVLPVTKTGQALQAVTQDSNNPLAHIGNLLGKALATPETKVREAAGLSEFGEWGDYYIDRMLASMVAEGTVDLKEAQIAMIEHEGDLYDMARNRVMLEMAFKQPGALPIYAAQHLDTSKPWLSAMEMGTALIYGLYPASILPEGEMIQRGLSEEYKRAGELRRMGYGDAYQDFFNEHPEYKARLALFDEPEERMKNFLASEIWDSWRNMGSLERELFKEGVGPGFQENFLDDPTGNYGQVEVTTLAGWAKAMNAMTKIPEPYNMPEVVPDPEIRTEALKAATPGEISDVNAYRELKKSLFPNIYALNDRYFNLPEGSQARRDFLAEFPEVKAYWEWNKAYKATHPAVEKYTKTIDETYVMYDLTFVSEFTPTMARNLYSYYYADNPLSDGAISELHRIWEQYYPNLDFEIFIDKVVKSAIAPDL